MQSIAAGENWNVSLHGVVRKVKVIGKTDMPGWWQCIDLGSGVEFTARERWFVGRAEAIDGADNQ